MAYPKAVNTKNKKTEEIFASCMPQRQEEVECHALLR